MATAGKKAKRKAQPLKLQRGWESISVLLFLRLSSPPWCFMLQGATGRGGREPPFPRTLLHSRVKIPLPCSVLRSVRYCPQGSWIPAQMDPGPVQVRRSLRFCVCLCAGRAFNESRGAGRRRGARAAPLSCRAPACYLRTAPGYLNVPASLVQAASHQTTP